VVEVVVPAPAPPLEAPRPPPACATAGFFGVILNSVSDRDSPPLGAPALAVEEVDVEVVVVAAALAVLVDVLLLEELEELDEPHPASRPATVTGTSETNRRIG
jgi:hypothetical protein